MNAPARTRCADCGSLNVRQLVWRDPNTGTIEIAHRSEATWCGDCCEHVELVGRHRRDGTVLQRLEVAGVDGALRRMCAEACVPLVEVVGRSRMRPVVAVRHAFWSALRDRGWSYPAIGRLFGRHHATVMHGIRAHKAFHAKESDRG